MSFLRRQPPRQIEEDDDDTLALTEKKQRLGLIASILSAISSYKATLTPVISKWIEVGKHWLWIISTSSILLLLPAQRIYFLRYRGDLQEGSDNLGYIVP